MNGEQPKNPLHGVTLESVVVKLVEHYGWDELATSSLSDFLFAKW